MSESVLSSNTILRSICRKHLSSTILSIEKIEGLGSVNEVFEIKTGKGISYILRLNQEDKTSHEYPKEAWCLKQAHLVGIPSPEVMEIGYEQGYSFMLQTKIEGVNASLLSEKEQIEIWEQMGGYLHSFSKIPTQGFGDKIINFEQGRFDDSWSRYLDYNLGELHPNDPLLTEGIISKLEQQLIRSILSKLKSVDPVLGLVHGDLSCRNVIAGLKERFLLDWGTAEVHFYPHMEVGILLNSPQNELDEPRLEAFLSGLGWTQRTLKAEEELIRQLLLLKRLDTFRWALAWSPENIQRYIQLLKQAIEKVK